MQKYKSVEKFLFCSEIYLMEKEEDNFGEFNKIPLNLFASIISLYFYSINPQKSFDLLCPNQSKDGGKKGGLFKSSIKSNIINNDNNSNIYLTSELSSTSQIRGIGVSRPRNFEDFILIKLNQSDIFLSDYDLDKVTLEYKQKNNQKKYKFKFRHSGNKEKNIIKCLLIIEGYKYSIKNSQLIIKDFEKQNNLKYIKEKSFGKRCAVYGHIQPEVTYKKFTIDLMNTEFIIHFIDNLIVNKFKILLIDKYFFQEEPNVLKIFSSCLTEFKEIQFKVNLFEEFEHFPKREKTNGNNLNNEESFAAAFKDRFNFDNIENKLNYNNNQNISHNLLTNNISTKFVCSSFKFQIINASNTSMNDKGFNKAILPLIPKSPFLEELILNNNLLTEEIFNKLNELNFNFYLKKIDLSYNKIKGNNLTNNLRSLVTSFFELEFINLKGNLIQTSSINQFSPKKFNELLLDIRKRINESDDNEKIERTNKKIKIDLRENLIDIEKVENKFYLLNNQLFLKYMNNKRKGYNEELDEDNDDLNKNEEIPHVKNIMDGMSIKFDENLFNTENFIFLFDYPYKGPNYFSKKNMKSINRKSINIKIETKRLAPKINEEIDYKINKKLKFCSLEFYQKIFKFLFIIDYYFDPILNSFSNTYSVFLKKYKEPLSPNNEITIYEEGLKKYIGLDKTIIDSINDKKNESNLKYKKLIKSDINGFFVDSNKNIELKSKYLEKNETTEDDKISSKYERKEIPLNEAKEMYFSYKYYTKENKKIIDITKELFNIDQEDFHLETGIVFNPNSYINQLKYFYKFIMSLSRTDKLFHINLTSFNKLISRIKIECYLANKERDFFSLKTLSEIVHGINLRPCDVKTMKKYEFLILQSSIIDNGLEGVINFVDLTNLSLINSYLDIFMTETNGMNYQSDLTFLCEYVQYLRNNFIRKKIYEELYVPNNDSTYVTKIQNDFDEIYQKYLYLSDTLILSIPKEIYYKELCVHPSLLDYLKISIMEKYLLEKDLNIIKNIVENSGNLKILMFEYGIKNIYNRLTFLFMKNTKKVYPLKYGYTLSKKNKYMKFSRLLFRFNNHQDNKNIYYKLISKNRYNEYNEQEIFNSNNLTDSLFNIVSNITNFNTKIKTNNKLIRELNKIAIKSGVEVVENIQKIKLELLRFSPKEQYFTIIDIESELKNLTKEKKKIFQIISRKFYSKLLEINNNTNTKIIYFNRMYRRTKELIRYILNIRKILDSPTNHNFLMVIYKEMFYSCLKFMNRDNFNFCFESIEKSNKNIKKFSFGLLYLILFYLDFNIGMKVYIKEFFLYLYVHRYYPNYCKNIIKALNNNYRYDWVMSSFEMHCRLFHKKIIEIKIYFGSNKYEKYYIDEHTTVYDLFMDIYNNSELFKEFKDKKSYWIYLVENDPLKNELLPNSIKREYEEEIKEIKQSREGNKKINEKKSRGNNEINSCGRKNDDDYLKYLNDNKGFNKEMFSLHQENHNNNFWSNYNSEEEDLSMSKDESENCKKENRETISNDDNNKNNKSNLYNIEINNLLRINLKSHEFVLEILGNIEEKMQIDFGNKLQSKLKKNYNYSGEESSFEEENNFSCEEEREKENYLSCTNISYESSTRLLPDDAFKFDLVFIYFHFQICRRFYNPYYLINKKPEEDNIISKIDNLSIAEKETIFEQLSKLFSYDKRNEVVKYDIGKKLGVLLISNMRLYNKEISNSPKLIKYKKEHLYQFFFPRKILKHRAFQNIKSEELEKLIYERTKSTENQKILIQEFIKLCMNYKEFFSSIYNNVFIDIDPDNYQKAKTFELHDNFEKVYQKHVNISINSEGICLLDTKTYTNIMNFTFEDIVNFYLKDEYTIKISIFKENFNYPVELKFSMIFCYVEEYNSSKNRKKNNIRKKIYYNELDAYFLYEDIITLIQYNLIVNTKTSIIAHQEDFNYIYHRNNKYQNFLQIKKINENDLNQFINVKKKSSYYKYYKYNKLNKKETEIKIIKNEKSIEDTEKQRQIEKEKEIKNERNKKLMKKRAGVMEEINKIKERAKMMIKLRERENENEESEDDFFKDNVVIKSLNKEKEKKIQMRREKLEIIHKKTINIQQILKKYENPDKIMKELEEERKKLKEKVNSSILSLEFSSNNDSIRGDVNIFNNDNKNIQKDIHLINLFKYIGLNEKEKKHYIIEKQLIDNINNAKNILKDRDLVNIKKLEKRINDTKKNKSFEESDSSFLSALSKRQKYPF